MKTPERLLKTSWWYFIALPGGPLSIASNVPLTSVSMSGARMRRKKTYSGWGRSPCDCLKRPPVEPSIVPNNAQKFHTAYAQHSRYNLRQWRRCAIIMHPFPLSRRLWSWYHLLAVFRHWYMWMPILAHKSQVALTLLKGQATEGPMRDTNRDKPLIVIAASSLAWSRYPYFDPDSGAMLT